MTENRLELTHDDNDFLLSIFEIIGQRNASELLNPIDVFAASRQSDASDRPTRKLLVLLRDYKNKLLKEKEYQDLKDKTIYNPPGQRWAAPSDQQEDMWLLRFHDRDCAEAIFAGEDAEKEAWKAWNRYSPSFNINLFRLAEIPKPE